MIGHRKDIEGMRAVAILLVVAAHASVPGLAGGFVGVDVFFVLSGYLITSLLVKEIRTTGRVDFAAFYARRFRRLMPALIVMLVGASVVAALVLPPADQIGQAASAASAALWASNLHFGFSDLGYFDAGAESNIFLHTWSLGVEEQFYLVWPALLVVALGSRWGSEARLKGVMLTLFAVSLAACLILGVSAPNLAFYLMPTRGWEFALGALVALYGLRLPSWAGWAGLATILAAAAYIGPTDAYPSALALLPSLGTAAVIAAGAQSRGVVSLLSLPPMQALGRLSYGWYLWHWPVLLLGAVLLPDTPIGIRNAALVVLALALAALSYRFVENPVRISQRWVQRPQAAVVASLAVIVAGFGLALGWSGHAQKRMTAPEQLAAQRAKSDAPLIYAMGCDDWHRSADVKLCAFGPSDAPHTALVMGDSIGLQWFPALAEIYRRPGWRLLVLTKSSCPMVDAPFFYARLGREYTECDQWRAAALKRVAAIKPDMLILGSTSTYGFSEAEWVEGTARVLRAVAGHVGQVRILRSTPSLPFDGPACLAPAALIAARQCSAPAASAQGDAVYRWLQEAASRFGNVATVDMTDAACPGGQCRAEIRGAVVFRDSQHLSAAFARSLSAPLADRLR